MNVYEFRVPGKSHYYSEPDLIWVAAEDGRIAERLLRMHMRYSGTLAVFELIDVDERCPIIDYRQRAVCPRPWMRKPR